MASYTYLRICITGGLELKELFTLKIQILPNKHGIAVMEGMVKEESEAWKGNLKDHVVKIYLLKKDGSMPKQPLFAGFVKTAERIVEKHSERIKITLFSGSIVLDREVKSSSFQNVNWSYEEILKKTIQDIPYAEGIFLEGKTIYPVKPLIQYRETNWEFILRLASHLNTVVYPNVKTDIPEFYFGMPKEKEIVKWNEQEYIMGISGDYYEAGGIQSGYDKWEFQYYKVQSFEDYNIGATAEFQGGFYKICKKEAELVGSHLVFTYTLGKEGLVALKPRYNPLFAGMSILGNVLWVGGETVKIHLDIDKEQKETEAYPYEWAPDTGSVMYCMPQVGTRVSLYFSGEEENSAMAVNCVRTNGATCEKTSNTKDRYLATEHGKELFLKPDSIGMDMEESGQFLSLLDQEGICFDSSKNITIMAGNQVKLKGKQVEVQAPAEIKFEKY